MHIKIAFFNGNLLEDMYTTQLEIFTSSDVNKVCKLQRSIYEFKQASWSWFFYFDEIIKKFCVVKNKDEPKVSESGLVILVLYINDMLLMETTYLCFNLVNV